MIEQDLEKRVIDAIKNLHLVGALVQGAWQTAAEGELKNEEELDVAVVSVVAGGRMFDTAGSCRADLPISVSLAVREDLDARGDKFAAMFAPLASMFQSWQLDCVHASAEFQSMLGVDGFKPFAVIGLNCGTPTRTEDGIWNITISFSIRGTVTH